MCRAAHITYADGQLQCRYVCVRPKAGCSGDPADIILSPPLPLNGGPVAYPREGSEWGGGREQVGGGGGVRGWRPGGPVLKFCV